MLIKLSNILSRGLPKTGQVTSYASGDDGDHQAGWWKGLLNSDNRTRFISKTIDGDDVVIDRATGLMWAADGFAEGCNDGDEVNWQGVLDYAESLDFAGFTDWRVPNIKELASIVDYSRVNPAIDETFFPNTNADSYWSSTTFAPLATECWRIVMQEGYITLTGKTSDGFLRCVRGGI